MNRRTFLKLVGATGAGVAAGLSILPKKREPMWISADYECHVVYGKDAFERIRKLAKIPA